MSVSVTMPRLGESVSEGTVTRWLKKEGERVELDEPLLEVSTDKVDTEIPSPVAGTLLRIVVQEDLTVEVGTEIALIGDDSDASAMAVGTTVANPPAAAEAAAPETSPVQAPPAKSPAAYITPLVRKLATEHGVDLTAVVGNGVGGRIRKQDVLDAATATATAATSATTSDVTMPSATTSPAAPVAPAPVSTPIPPAHVATPQVAPAAVAAATIPGVTPLALRGRTEPLSRLRKVIAARMVESLQVSAQLTTIVEVDVTAIARLRDQVRAAFEAREGVKLTFLPFFAIAAIEALRAHPMVNASLDMQAGTVTYHDDVNLGIAVDTERGLLVPVIAGAGDLSLAGLARRVADVADRTRANQVSADELSGGTFTLTNTGSRGALFDTPILNQPQVGILGTGAVVKRPVVVDDATLGEIVAVRSMVYLALTYDHRIVDGADAARFLSTIKERLETADFTSLLGL